MWIRLGSACNRAGHHPEHSLYVSERSDQESRPKPIGHEELNEHWVGAGHLKVGDKIRKADGTFGTVANVTTVQGTRTMYNLEVQEAHTFFVGTQGWLVHNQSSCLNAKLILSGKKCDLPAEFYANQCQRVGADDLTNAADGHLNRHSMPKQEQADILNDWERSFKSYNNNGRPVDIYMKSTMVVITKFGNKSDVITACGGK